MAKKVPHRPRIRRGDEVLIVTGASRGRRGRVLRVDAEKSEVIVEGVNLVFRHIRRSEQHPQGGRLRREAPIHLSNVMAVDPNEDVPTKVGRVLRDPEKGSLGKVRIARKSGADLDAAAQKSGKKGRKAKE
jgi:large subunit ribosomal protein L24